MKLFYGVMALACVPAALGANNAPYPNEKVAEFVVQKLDVTTLPSAIRPKREKGKKTFAEYGYVTRQIAEKEALVEAAPGDSQINIRVLERKSSGIFICVEGQAKNASTRTQRVYLLKRKGQNDLLKGKESWQEFDGCPVIGDDDDAAASSYGG